MSLCSEVFGILMTLNSVSELLQQRSAIKKSAKIHLENGTNLTAHANK